MKRALSALLAIALLTGCTGCLAARSLERYGYVLAIGFDRGEQLPYSVALLLERTQTESESQNNGGFLAVKAECRTLLEGIETLSAGLPLATNTSRTGMIVVSVALLNDAAFLHSLAALPYSRLYIRYNTSLFASLSPAYDTLAGLSNELDPNLSRIETNLASYSEDTGLIPMAHLAMLIEALNGQTYDLSLPLCGVTSEDGTRLTRDSVGMREYAYIGGSLAIKSEMETSLAGAALLDGGRMVGVLDGQNVQLLTMALGTFCRGRRLLTLPRGDTVPIYLRAKKSPQTVLTFSGGQARAVMTISLDADVEASAHIDATEAELVAAVETALTQEIEQLFACCRALGSDAMGFGRHAVKRFRSARAWEAFDWKRAYREMEADFIFDVHLPHPLKEAEWE